MVPSVRPTRATPEQVARAFRSLLDAGARLRASGASRRAPRRLLTQGYGPRYRFALFDAQFFLSGMRQIPDLRFYVAYVVQKRRDLEIHPRIFYKDVSLVWRSASHFTRCSEGLWIGKGEVRSFWKDGEEHLGSVEATTDLPFEMQTVLETLCRREARVAGDGKALGLVLRRAPAGRIEPYAEFTAARRRARANPRNRIHGGRPVARFTRRNDPTSLRFAPGYAPDFAAGVVERAASTSKLYGGRVRRFRILSHNREIQFLFFAGRRHVWLAPPQATTTELSSFGLRTLDVEAPEDLSLPAYEYHYMDDSTDPPELMSQIPPGFAGPPSPADPSRADASRWIESMPVVRSFRRHILG